VTITTRRACPEDAATLARMRYTFRAAQDAPIEPIDVFVERCERWMADRLREGRWHGWVAEQDRRIIGNLWLHLIEKIPNPVDEPETHAYISNLYVEEALRGRGVGATLLETAIDFCRERKVDKVILWPTARSRSLYSRHGFVEPQGLLELRSGSKVESRKSKVTGRGTGAYRDR
jgi:GNAT superfamily N-acetyltransferase